VTARAAIKYPGKVAIRRAVQAARDNGIDVGGVEVSPDGSIRIIDLRAIPRQPVDEFERWEAKL
jgi:hypothetical protein